MDFRGGSGVVDIECLRNAMRRNIARICRGGHLQIALRQFVAVVGRLDDAADVSDRRILECDLCDEAMVRASKRTVAARIGR